MLAFANLSELALPLTRGVILARLLEPTQFGLAISITMIASSMELMSDLGIGQQALRSGTTDTLATLHALAIIRGALLGLVIAAAGPLFAWMFDAPGTAWVYSLVGLASFIRGFTHLETRVQLRDYHYAPEALSIFGMQAIWTVVSIIAASYLHDYRAMVIGLIASAVGAVAITHLCSRSRYRLGWQKDLVDESIRFGKPLAANGVTLVIGSLGDRFLIGLFIGLAQLAQYTALSTAAFMPRSSVTKFTISVFVPQFVNTEDHHDRRRLANIWIVLIAGVGSVFGFCFVAFGQFIVATAFGRHYTISQTLISLIAALACIRYMAIIPIVPSLANGRTSLVFWNTTLAASGILLGAICLPFNSDLHVLIGAMIVGEGAGLFWILQKLRREVLMSSVVLWVGTLAPLLMLMLVVAATMAVPTMTTAARWTLCGCGIIAELFCSLCLLRLSGSTVRFVLQSLLPRRRRALQPAFDPSS